MDDMFFDTSELRRLVDDLGRVSGRMVPQVTAVVTEHGAGLAQDWANNARQTSGTHGRHYPSSITSEVKFRLGFTSDIVAEVGPDSSRRQGSMGRGFEYGSVNQTPHLDGNRAADTRESLFVADLTKIVQGEFG